MVNFKQNQVELFRYLWDGSQSEWILAERGSDKPYFTFWQTERPHKFIVFNKETGRRLILEDGAVLAQVVENMRDSNVELVDFQTYKSLAKQAMAFA